MITDTHMHNLQFASVYQNTVIPALDELSQRGYTVLKVQLAKNKASIEISPINQPKAERVLRGRKHYQRIQLCGCSVVWES